MKSAGDIPSLKRIVSGGQTGVDRAALDAALRFGIPIGGWCPRGRRAEDGVIPAKYPLMETRSVSYRTRTRWNVRDSDGSLIICRDVPTGGTALTIQCCEKLDKPYILCCLGPDPAHWAEDPERLFELLRWLKLRHVRVLNVAGPRERKNHPIYRYAYALLCSVFTLVKEREDAFACSSTVCATE